MPVKKELEQHIAVFGGSGSGKTVLVSSFYGRAEEEGFAEANLLDIVVSDPGQRGRLFKNYLGMRDTASVPDPNKFRSHSYSFAIQTAKHLVPKANNRAPFNAVRLVWHDYPGEWFEQKVAGEEAARRVDAFRALLSSDVALLLVDGQKLLDNAGREEAYLRSLFHDFRHGLEDLQDEILSGGKLVQFPRIWILALSKSDLLPEMTAQRFEELVILKASDGLDKLRKVIEEIVQAPEALAIGEDYLLLSSAEFSPTKIDLTKRVGVDLILPIAAMLPYERHARWAKNLQLPQQVAQNLLDGADGIVALIDTALSAGAALPGKVGRVFMALRLAVQGPHGEVPRSGA